MSNYLIIDDNRPKPGFDAHVQGLLLNEKGEIISNPFTSGEGVKIEGSYIIKAIGKKSEPGKFRDKLSLKIQNNEPLFVVSKKLEDVLKENCQNIDFYNLTIKKEGQLICDYKIVNITKAVNCINHEDSELVYWESTHDTVFNINGLVLNEEVIPRDLNIFILGEVRGTVVVVHQTLKNAILEQKITGCNFCEMKDFVL
jgi:hypothetical protein